MLKIQSILHRSDDHIDLFVRVTPNGSRDEITGIVDCGEGEYRLALKVRAVPEKGKANKAVIKLVAKLLGQPKSSITVASGSATRQKTLRITGDANGIISSLDRFFLPEIQAAALALSIDSTISRRALSLSIQSPILTHFPGSRSL